MKWIPSFARDLAAFVIALLACPISVFGGANVGCVGQAGFKGDCATTMVFLSPLILIAGGGAAGLITKGWTGLLATVVGVLAGMVAILLISNFIGRPVPPDFFTGVIATVWFMVPTTIGYGMGLVVRRLFATRAS